MSNANEEQEYWNASERHHQIMEDGERFVRRLFFGCLAIVVIILGAVIFFLFNYHPFWKYP